MNALIATCTLSLCRYDFAQQQREFNDFAYINIRINYVEVVFTHFCFGVCVLVQNTHVRTSSFIKHSN